MGELTNSKKKALAERMFIEEGMLGKAIAAALDVSEVTISNWRKAGNWDTRKSQHLAAPYKIREKLLDELTSVSGGNKPSIDADSLAKIAKVIDSLSSKTSVQVIITVFKEFDNWMADQDPDLAVKFLEYHKLYILHKAETE